VKHSGAYAEYALVREMLETASIIGKFNPGRVREIAPGARPAFLTGEGSSRLFPAKRTVVQALRDGRSAATITEGCTQALEYELNGYEVYVASNSGRTAEAVRLITTLKERGSSHRIVAIVANGDSPVMDLADTGLVLECGTEVAVAATKSVVEQALIYHAAFEPVPSGPGSTMTEKILGDVGGGFEQALTGTIPAEIVRSACAADTIYFAGRNDGVAEELTLKTNEITRKKADYLEGTYPVHGIEEVMQETDLVVLVDPFPDEEAKLHDVLVGGVGLRVVAIADRQTQFPTIRVPTVPGFGPYLQLAAGWNLLVEIGMELGIDLDRPVRARKVGNEITG